MQILEAYLVWNDCAKAQIYPLGCSGRQACSCVDRLAHLGVHIFGTHCIFCAEEVESIDHLLFQCESAYSGTAWPNRLVRIRGSKIRKQVTFTRLRCIYHLHKKMCTCVLGEKFSAQRILGKIIKGTLEVKFSLHKKRKLRDMLDMMRSESVGG